MRQQDRNQRGSASVASVSSRVPAEGITMPVHHGRRCWRCYCSYPTGGRRHRRSSAPNMKDCGTRRTGPFCVSRRCVPIRSTRSSTSLSRAAMPHPVARGRGTQYPEYTHNPVWGDDPQDDHGVFLQRHVLFGDLHLGPRVRVFGELLQRPRAVARARRTRSTRTDSTPNRRFSTCRHRR